MKLNLECPHSMASHIGKVFKGEYAIPLEYIQKINDYKDSSYKPTILDIGANIGSFTIWASHIWKDATIHCYEPSKDNYAFLTKNIENICKDKKENIFSYNYGIGDSRKTKLYDGLNNCGERSLYQLGEQKEEYETVEIRNAKELPDASILKMDAEGSELTILKSLRAEKKIHFDFILFEYHWKLTEEL